MRSWLIKIAVCVVMVTLSAQVHAGPHEVKYIEPNLSNVIDFVFANGAIDVNDPVQMVDYVLIKDCSLYRDYYKDDFSWNKIRHRIIEDSKELNDKVLTHFVMPASFLGTRYNFKTKAFDLDEESQLRNVNIMPLIRNEPVSLCPGMADQVGSVQLRYLPSAFQLKLDTPLSLYRIPMAEEMGRKVLSDLEFTKDDGSMRRIIYALVYVSADSVLDMDNMTGILLGRIDKIEFFLDQARQQKIRTLVYSEL